MKSTERFMWEIQADNTLKDLEKAGVTPEVMAQIVDGLEDKILPIPDTLPEQLLLFQKEIGEEMFKTLSAGGNISTLLKEWRENRGELNFTLLYNVVKEKAPNLDKDEFRLIFALGNSV